ncbi:hypothetical protein BGZ83_001947 [Gryganskiella cystojenkinii]|nr:hypothetical protein BGZ83_001947 [Gryganskiella cystojenkinii]
MEIDPPDNSTCKEPHQSDNQHTSSSFSQDSPPSDSTQTSIQELEDLIQWLVDQKQRIETEIQALHAHGQDTESLIKFWHVLVKQIKSLEVDLVVESTEAMSI